MVFLQFAKNDLPVSCERDQAICPTGKFTNSDYLGEEKAGSEDALTGNLSAYPAAFCS